MLRLAGGPGQAGGWVVGWVQAAGFAGLVLWGGLAVTRSAPWVWGRPLPAPTSAPTSAAWLVGMNGLLVALTVFIVMSRRWFPVIGDFFFWFSGLPIMLAVAVQPRWGLTAYVAAALLAMLVLSPIAGYIFTLFTGLLGATSGLAVARRAPLLHIGLWCAALQVPAQMLLLRVPGFHMFGLRPSMHGTVEAVSLVGVALILGFGWMFTVRPLYPRLARRRRTGGVVEEL